MNFEVIAIFVPVVIGLTQVVKDTKFVDKRFIPAVAVLLGVALAWFLGNSLVDGVVMGLMSTGLFSAGKQIVTE